MEQFALLARLEAKPGKEQELRDFLTRALPLAEAEPGTVRWYALQIGPATFGIFDTFEDATKVSSGSSSGIDSFIRYSRLWGDNTRWVERVALYIQAI